MDTVCAERGWELKGEAGFGSDQNVLKFIVVMVAYICEYLEEA